VNTSLVLQNFMMPLLLYQKPTRNTFQVIHYLIHFVKKLFLETFKQELVTDLTVPDSAFVKAIETKVEEKTTQGVNAVMDGIKEYFKKEFLEFKTEVKQEIQGLKNEVQGLKNEVREMKNEVQEMNITLSRLELRFLNTRAFEPESRIGFLRGEIVFTYFS
jgi:SMC interacting uncharacterized protein involved in chromosome segregation